MDCGLRKSHITKKAKASISLSLSNSSSSPSSLSQTVYFVPCIYTMNLVTSKVGSYWVGQQANSHLSSVSNDINSLSTSIEGGSKWLVNKMKGKAQKPLTELLKEYDMPVGLFPREATNYEFDLETKKLLVNIPTVCEVMYRDQSVLRFSTTVTGILEIGKLTEIDGIKTKFILWLKVSCISSEETKLNFAVGITRSRERSAYEYVRDGVIADKF